MRSLRVAAALAALCLFAGPVEAACGTASWYGAESGRRTANGDRFNPHGLTAAHRTLRFGTVITVRDIRSGKTVKVRVNDRGPARRTGRIIDLSRGAASQLGFIGRGVTRVCFSELAS